MTTCYPDSMKVKRDIERRIEDYVIKYCEALEENFKQYSIESLKRNLQEQRFPENNNYYQDQLNAIEDGTANLYKFDYKIGKKYIKVFNLQYDTFQNRNEYREGSVHAFVNKETGQVYKPASWRAPAKHVRYDMRIIKEREFLFNSNNTGWAGGYLYLR